ncbi:zona pellucida sperm-binding protein 3-like [Acipenser oxyrinchus oxyrinchus]|uniref:Zona pellucida sperm-binding protein 3 n=1 Tax=Acipenser oxyrinchus oxyrinchus TaxID=40147 RepID=A0AAD8FU38_ACIOX|nr:zona pellucida sperm-binding protein 3-like [Acipenser oxyrinchus oxyrinchus]
MLFAKRAEFLTTASVIVVLLAVLQGAFSWEDWPRVPIGQKQRDSSAVQLQDSNDLSASPQFKRSRVGQQLKDSAVRVAQQIKSFVDYLKPPNPPQPGGRAVLPQPGGRACGEAKVVVTVKRDLFGNGQLIKASDVSLGSCGVTRQDDATQSVIFEAQLQECGSTLMMVADQLVYSFTLKYQPSRNFNQPIVRSNSAQVSIECRYMRKQNVSSNALRPTWRPFSSTRSAEGALGFSLKLLADDWLTQRTSNVYSLGDVLNIEASIDGSSHTPLRLFVDSCVATMVPDRNASPRYVFIENSGCLVDAKVSGSGSRFISPRVQNTKLQLRLDAFRFYSDPRSSIYITCHLKVAAASQNVDSVNKACSFTASSSRWSSVDGSDQVCSCCNTGSCGMGAPYRGRRGSEAADSMVLDWEGDARVGPLVILETLPDLDAPKQPEAPSLQLEAEDRTARGFPVEVLVLAGVVSAVALGCIAALAAVLYRRPGKPADLQF